MINESNRALKQRIAELELIVEGYGEPEAQAQVQMTPALDAVQASVSIKAQEAKENIAIYSFKASVFQTAIRWGTVLALSVGCLIAFT